MVADGWILYKHNQFGGSIGCHTHRAWHVRPSPQIRRSFCHQESEGRGQEGWRANQGVRQGGYGKTLEMVKHGETWWKSLSIKLRFWRYECHKYKNDDGLSNCDVSDDLVVVLLLIWTSHRRMHLGWWKPQSMVKPMVRMIGTGYGSWNVMNLDTTVVPCGSTFFSICHWGLVIGDW